MEAGSRMFVASPEKALSKQENLSENFDTTGIDEKVAYGMQCLNPGNEPGPAVSEPADDKKGKVWARAAAERMERRTRWRRFVVIAAAVAVAAIVFTKK